MTLLEKMSDEEKGTKYCIHESNDIKNNNDIQKCVKRFKVTKNPKKLAKCVEQGPEKQVKPTAVIQSFFIHLNAPVTFSK
jgi:hypothetical protein